MNDRNALRRDARRRRALAAASGSELATTLLEHFLASVLHSEHRVIAGYWPVGKEIDDLPILRKLRSMNKVVALPCVVADDAPLVFRGWDDSESVVPGRYSIPTPPETAPVLKPTLVVVPLLLFDGTGHRLGSGKGFYDRTLASLRKTPIVAVGVAYAAQRTAKLAALATDQRLDGVVTEEGAEWF
jgi:5-formyltetrahydrofolate cyclo-ligase